MINIPIAFMILADIMGTSGFYQGIQMFHIDDTVDYIFEESFGDFFRGIEKYRCGDVGINDILLRVRDFPENEISQEINNLTIQKAQSLFPIEIIAGTITGKSQYLPEKVLIEISLNPTVYNRLVTSVSEGITYNDMVAQAFREGVGETFLYELSGEKTKNTIAHELSHWLDDVFHNRHLYNMSRKTKGYLGQNIKGKAAKTLLRGRPYVYMTDYEINAIVHGINQMKRGFSQTKWNDLTLNSLIRIDTSLNLSNTRITERFGKEECATWKKLILKRLHREGILGNSMNVGS